MEPLIVGGVVVAACLLFLHGLDRWLDRAERLERQHRHALRRAQLLRDLGKAPPAPGTMRRRYSDLPDSLPEDGDEGGRPVWPGNKAA